MFPSGTWSSPLSYCHRSPSGKYPIKSNITQQYLAIKRHVTQRYLVIIITIIIIILIIIIVLKVLVLPQGKSLKIVLSLTFSSFCSFYVLFIK